MDQREWERILFVMDQAINQDTIYNARQIWIMASQIGLRN